MITLNCGSILATVQTVLRGLWRWWVITLDRRAILATVYVVWVILGGMGCLWVVMFKSRTILASVHSGDPFWYHCLTVKLKDGIQHHKQNESHSYLEVRGPIIRET